MKQTICNLFFISLFFISCQGPEVKEYQDTAVSGEIVISVDETFEPIIDSEIFTFQSIYNRSKIVARYTSEKQAFQDLLNDSSRLIITTRELNTEEKKYFEGIQLSPKITRIATDAIAFIIHPENTDSVFKYDQLTDLFQGKIRLWSEVNTSSKKDEIHVVFDNSNSSTARFLKERLTGGGDLPSNCYALNTNEEVIRFCNENKNSLGVIGVNWISDGDDPSSLKFKEKIKVVGIMPSDTAAGAGRAYKPFQAYIAQRYYPFLRDIFIISREARSGLGSGFASFVAGDKGQRIILKSGLMPATKPVRIVGFR